MSKDNIKNDKVLPVEQRKACPGHPGEILKELYIDTYKDLTVNKVARRATLSRAQVLGIINKTESVGSYYADCLADALKTTPGLWLKLQANYDKWMEVNG